MNAPVHRSSRSLRAVVLLSGTGTMALQMATVRLLAPWVGASSFVWATVIGLSLSMMTVGYVLGGRLADRRADGPLLARTLLAAALLVAMVPFVAPALLPHVDLGIRSAEVADLVGAAIGYLALVAAPALLLGVTPPFAIRLAMASVDHAGRAVGGLYALSTVGSIVGTLLTALVLVQWIGTRATLWAIAASLLVAAACASRVRARVERRSTPASRVPAVAPRLPRAAVVVVLVEGMATMATEMSIARLVAPFFGASHAVWAVIIATVMGSIALGSRLGGRCADRWPRMGALVLVLAAGSVAVGSLPFLAAPVMRLSTGGIDDVAVGTVVGSFLATMALLVVPVTLLGMVPPWVLRLVVPDVERAGRVAGRLYGLSTLGALVGTFASVLWLIPAIGTRRTILVFAGALGLLAVGAAMRAGVIATDRRVPRPALAAALLATGVVALLGAAPTGLVKPIDGAAVLAEEESRYQFVQVVEEPDGRRLLQLNEGWAVHSIREPDTVFTGGIWDHFLALPDLAADDGRMLVVGSAGGTTKRAFAALRPDVAMTSVELDPEVTRAGRTWFGLTGPVVAADGRPFLRRTRESWDVVHVDAYRQPYIPFYLTTREFFELARSRLAPGGVLSINVGAAPSDPRMVEAVSATMRAVFPIVVRYRAERYNELVVAIDDPDVTIDELRERLRDGVAASDTRTRGIAEDFAEGMVAVDPSPGRVLTDDRAPVEWMTDRMIFGEAG